jgi:hypothetical protein
MMEASKIGLMPPLFSAPQQDWRGLEAWKPSNGFTF